MRWTSIHIFMNSFDELDPLISQIYSRLNKSILNRLFFIRYWYGGPHIRIRIINLNKKENIIIKKQINAAIRTIIQSKKNSNKPLKRLLPKEEFYKSTFTDGKIFDSNQLPWFSPGEVLEIPYMPENYRYGGKDNIFFSEQAFITSSKLAASIVISNVHPVNRFIFFKVFLDWSTEKLIGEKQSYKLYMLAHDYWSSKQVDDNQWYKITKEINSNQISELRKSLEKMSDVKLFIKQLDVILNHISDLEEKYALSILISHYHMLANRLGIGIAAESASYKL